MKGYDPIGESHFPVLWLWEEEYLISFFFPLLCLINCLSYLIFTSLVQIVIPGSCLSFVLGLNPPKGTPFPFKKRVIWVSGKYTYPGHTRSYPEYGLPSSHSSGTVETQKEKAADTAKQDFTDATVAFEAKSKCILAAILLPFCEFPKIASDLLIRTFDDV